MEGPLFELDSNKRCEAMMRPLFELFPGPLLKSGLGPLVRYGTHQKTISGRPEQKYLPSDPRLEWPAEGLLFKPACFRKFQTADPDRQILNIKLLPRKSKKRCKKKQVKRTLLG